MPGLSLDKDDILALRNDHPNGVMDVFSGDELEAYKSLIGSNLDPDYKKEIRISLKKILVSIRGKIFDNKELPSDFPDFLRPIGDIFSEHSSDVGIIIDDDKINPEQVEEWVINTISAQNNITKNEVERMLKLKPRTWFDGEISVQIISQTEVEKTRKSLPFG